MTDNRNIWVFIEQEEGRIAEVSLERLGKGQELARTLGSQVWALLCGYPVKELAEKLIAQGADHVLVAEHPELELYRTLPYSRVAVNLVQKWRPYIFLIGATPVGRDLAPRLACAVQAGLTSDCTDLQIGDYTSAKKIKSIPISAQFKMGNATPCGRMIRLKQEAWWGVLRSASLRDNKSGK